MKVKIQQRQVYHKFAEIEFDIDENEFDHYRLDNGKYTSIDEFISFNATIEGFGKPFSYSSLTFNLQNLLQHKL